MEVFESFVREDREVCKLFMTMTNVRSSKNSKMLVDVMRKHYGITVDITYDSVLSFVSPYINDYRIRMVAPFEKKPNACFYFVRDISNKQLAFEMIINSIEENINNRNTHPIPTLFTGYGGSSTYSTTSTVTTSTSWR